MTLIKKGLAFVCDFSADEIRANRGTLTEPGKESPYRNRSIEENLQLFEEMREGKYADGEKVLRAKIDMASPNINMRDPVIYRIAHAEHHNTGDKWCIYPMYDFAHPIEDAIEGITHSICTLEFEDHRPLYDWVLEAVGKWPTPPQQIEFARLNITNTIMSKRYLKALVDDGIVDGWDDPRMPTIAGIRRRGYTPEAVRDFCERIGVAKANSTVDVALLESCVRDDLKNKVEACQFESNNGGDRVALEVSKRVKEAKGYCNITQQFTTQNKETKIIVYAPWVKQHVIFKDRSMYQPNDDYGRMMSFLLGYSPIAKNKHDDVPDALSSFAKWKNRPETPPTVVGRRPF